MSMLRPGFTGVFVVGSQHLPGYAAKKSRKNTFKINDERHFGIFSQPPISDEGKKTAVFEVFVFFTVLFMFIGCAEYEGIGERNRRKMTFEYHCITRSNWIAG